MLTINTDVDCFVRVKLDFPIFDYKTGETIYKKGATVLGVQSKIDGDLKFGANQWKRTFRVYVGDMIYRESEDNHTVLARL